METGSEQKHQEARRQASDRWLRILTDRAWEARDLGPMAWEAALERLGEARRERAAYEGQALPEWQAPSWYTTLRLRARQGAGARRTTC